MANNISVFIQGTETWPVPSPGSYKEAFEDYFTSDEARICMPTAYAVQQGASTNDAGACGWWLRSPGNYPYNASYVSFVGSRDFNLVYNVSDCVRPALWINLDSDIF